MIGDSTRLDKENITKKSALFIRLLVYDLYGIRLRFCLILIHDRGYLLLLRCIAFVGAIFHHVSIVTLCALVLYDQVAKLFAYNSVWNWMGAFHFFFSCTYIVGNIGRYWVWKNQKGTKTTTFFHLWMFAEGSLLW